MSTFPVPANEKERLKALDNYVILDTLSEAEFDRITQLASLICKVPISLISLIDERRQWFKSKVGLEVNETPREYAFCQHAIMDEGILEVEDATADLRFKDNPFVTGEPNVRFYAGQPLIDPDGFALGALCVIDNSPRELTEDQKTGLRLLADEVIDLIVERRKKEELKNFEKLFEASNDFMFIGGTDGYLKKINPSFERILGWNKDYLLSTSTFEFIHPDDIEETEKELIKLSLGFNTVNFPQRIKTKNNKYRTIEWTFSPEQLTGNIFGIGRDITEEKIKEQKLEESEKKLRAFFENSQGLMCTHDLNGKFLSVNAAGAVILGYTVDEILGLTLFDVIPEERHPYLEAYLTQIKTEGRASGQMLTRHKNGSTRVWLYNNSLETTAHGSAYIIGNGIDITKRYQLESELVRAREMLEQTNKVARVGGWEFDVETQHITWTAITKEIHGVPPDFEPDLTTTLSYYRNENLDKITLNLEDAIKYGKPWDMQVQMQTPEGKEIWIRSLGNAEFDNGVCKRLYGTFQDINDFKIAEQALKKSIETQESLNNVLLEKIALITEQDQTIEKIKEFKFLADSIPEIIWTAQPEGKLDYCNQYWFDYSGMTREETLELGWEPIVHPDDVEKSKAGWLESVKTGKVYESEARFKRGSDGIYKWHLARARPMKNDTGQVVKWFGSAVNIDEYKRALELQNKISQYEDFNRIVAHNLRGPAASIEMIINMILESEDEEEKKEMFLMLKDSSVSLNETLSELMKILEVRNNFNLTYDDCDLIKIVEGVEKMLRGQIVSKKTTISTDFKQPIVKFPKIYLESIFYNLISNALKYSKADVPPEIKISSAPLTEKVLLTFKDNGLGIDLKRHGHDMFKLNKVFHAGFDSKGVGLFMTKTQIETFGGKITVESEPGVGSEFKIEL